MVAPAQSPENNQDGAQKSSTPPLEQLKQEARVLLQFLAESEQLDARREVQAIVKEIDGALRKGNEDGRLAALQTRIARLREIEKLALNPLQAHESSPDPSQQHLFSKVVTFRVPVGTTFKVFDSVVTANGPDGSLSGLEISPGQPNRTYTNLSYTLTQLPGSENSRFTEYAVGLRLDFNGQPIKSGSLLVEVDGRKQEFSFRGTTPTQEKLIKITADELEQAARLLRTVPQQKTPDPDVLMFPPRPRKEPVEPEHPNAPEAISPSVEPATPAPESDVQGHGPSRLIRERIQESLRATHGEPERFTLADGSHCLCWKVPSPTPIAKPEGTLIRLRWPAGKEDDYKIEWATASSDSLQKSKLEPSDVQDAKWGSIDTLYRQDRELKESWGSSDRLTQLRQNAFATYHNSLARRLSRVKEQGGDPATESLTRVQQGCDAFLAGAGKNLEPSELNVFLALDAAIAGFATDNAFVLSRGIPNGHSVEWEIGRPASEGGGPRLMTLRFGRKNCLYPEPEIYVAVGNEVAGTTIEQFDPSTAGLPSEFRNLKAAVQRAKAELVKNWALSKD